MESRPIAGMAMVTVDTVLVMGLASATVFLTLRITTHTLMVPAMAIQAMGIMAHQDSGSAVAWSWAAAAGAEWEGAEPELDN
jgi:hypothetical protein